MKDVENNEKKESGIEEEVTTNPIEEENAEDDHTDTLELEDKTEVKKNKKKKK